MKMVHSDDVVVVVVVVVDVVVVVFVFVVVVVVVVVVDCGSSFAYDLFDFVFVQFRLDFSFGSVSLSVRFQFGFGFGFGFGFVLLLFRFRSDFVADTVRSRFGRGDPGLERHHNPPPFPRFPMMPPHTVHNLVSCFRNTNYYRQVAPNFQTTSHGRGGPHFVRRPPL